MDDVCVHGDEFSPVGLLHSSGDVEASGVQVACVAQMQALVGCQLKEGVVDGAADGCVNLTADLGC